MGNVIGPCLCDAGGISRRHDIALVLSNSEANALDEGIGHSFCYIRPDQFGLLSAKCQDGNNGSGPATQTAMFRTISGASLSANTSTSPSTTLFDLQAPSSYLDRASSFESSSSFASVPLQPIPRNLISSGPLPRNSGSILGSGPIDRGFLSGPIERGFISGSGPIDRSSNLYSGSHDRIRIKSKYKFNRWGSIQGMREKIMNAFSRFPMKDADWGIVEANSSSQMSLSEDNFVEAQNLQWAEGKAGEDRIHVVISEDYGWVFVGIYDGFNGPDAPDFLLSNLYPAVHKELKAVIGSNSEEEEEEEEAASTSSHCCNQPSSRRWKCEFDCRCSEFDRISSLKIKHSDVLLALCEALRKTEEEYFKVADKTVFENPELSLMGSCVLVMLMIGEDIYLMNVGDSRAVIGQRAEPDIKDCLFDDLPNVVPLQLTVDHNTSVKEEVQRIKSEHPDDPSVIANDRVKGSLKVTRAFGAGFLKKARWNDGLLKMFRIDYVGSSPYITSSPSLYHYRFGPRDTFLILSSDGLYQYFTNEEAVSEVEAFMAMNPEGDPAQHLVEEVLFRAAKKGGMAFHELLEIPQGERRRYHDDVSIIIISLEGKIWRSSV